MFVNLESYFDDTVQEVQLPLKDCKCLYYANPNNGVVKLHKTVNSTKDRIVLEDVNVVFNNDGMPINSNLPQLFKPTQSNYDSLIQLYGISKVHALPKYKSHKQYIIDSLRNGKMVLCVTKNTIGKVESAYTTTLICEYDLTTDFYKSFDEKLYDDAVPINTDGHVIYELI